MTEPLLSVSVDVDPIGCYHAIHGLPPPQGAAVELVMTVAIPRLIGLFQSLGVRATFFLVGSTLAGVDGSAAAKALTAAGHELANHSHRHLYAFARLGRSDVEAEIRASHDAICQTGAAPVGFRAPGYALSPHMITLLADLGYTYDASLLPSPPYYLAKLAVLAKMSLLRRRSGSVLGHAGMMVGPRVPYRPNDVAPWRRGSSRLIELPMACTSWLRLPVIGTSLNLAPQKLRAYMLRSMGNLPLVSLELHALDVLDATDADLAPELALRQPDLSLPAPEKQATLAEAIAVLAKTRKAVTLAQAAELLAPEL